MKEADIHTPEIRENNFTLIEVLLTLVAFSHMIGSPIMLAIVAYYSLDNEHRIAMLNVIIVFVASIIGFYLGSKDSK